MQRTDEHRPSVIKGEDYQFICFQYYGSSDLGALLEARAERERFNAHREATGATFSGHEHGGVCHICGCGNISYASVFYHAKSNSYIVTGEDCANKLDLSGGDWNAFRAAIHNHLEAQAGKKKAQAILAQAGFTAAWELYTEPDAAARNNWRYEERTIVDIVGKLVRYGSISEKATAYIGTLLAKIPQRAELEAQKQAEQEAAAPCPSGRVEIKGEVLGLKVVESYFGDVTRILVKAESGFKVWGSRFDNVEKGDQVHFVATVEPSKDDPKFGFYKRPVVYVSPDAKKAQAKERKAQREAEKAQRAANIANNPDFYNAYSPDWTKYIMVDGTRVVNQCSLAEAIATWEKSKAEVCQ